LYGDLAAGKRVLVFCKNGRHRTPPPCDALLVRDRGPKGPGVESQEGPSPDKLLCNVVGFISPKEQQVEQVAP
jgi:hypothetical protein